MNRIVGLLLISLMMVGWSVAQEDAATLVAEGDSAFAKFDDATALERYEAVLETDSSHCEALWKAARSRVNLGEESDDLAEEHYPVAEELARKAVSVCPDNADANLTLAIAVGRLALLRGGRTKLELSKDVKTYALKTLELDPSRDIAHHVLARWHREVTEIGGLKKMVVKVIYGGLPDASKEKAVEHFQTAIELAPDYINHHLELGMTYETMEEWQKAKEAYETALSLSPQAPEDSRYILQARKRLDKVEKEL